MRPDRYGVVIPSPMWWCVGLHFVMLVAGLIVGWNWEREINIAPDFSRVLIPVPPVLRIAAEIAGNNLVVMAMLIAGNLCTVGVLGLGLMATNGVYAAFILTMMPWAIQYAPFEAAAFCLAGGGSMHLSWRMWVWLVRGDSVVQRDLRESFWCIGIAIIGGLLSALYEAFIVAGRTP